MSFFFCLWEGRRDGGFRMGIVWRSDGGVEREDNLDVADGT